MGAPAALCTEKEMMAISAGRLIRDGDIVFTGTGVPILAAMASKRIYAPKAVIFFETGGIDPSLEELPMAVGDSRVMSGSCLNSGLMEAFSIVGHRKLHTIALLGAAQIDKYGNLNSTSIGDYHHPERRLPGSGGASDAASLASGVMVFVEHERRRFVERLDYVTSVGWFHGGSSRQELGLVRGGPFAVVTNLGVMRFHEKTKEMYLAAYYPGVTIHRIIENTGFAMDVTGAEEAVAPTPEQLRILRQEVDPQGLIL
jgi:glutaconate CoA-transferase, subunit B